jgi:HEAT repeat protein
MTAPPAGERRRTVIVAGHRGDEATVTAHLDDVDPAVREAALGALDRIGSLTDDRVTSAFADQAPSVRRRAATLAANRPAIDLSALLDDADPTVVEVAAWACGEQVAVNDGVLERLIALATDADDPLVRESAAAALGAIGDERGLPAILAATTDKPNVRRRAVLALAPFDGDAVAAAIDRALTDRDWQVRQAAEDLRRATGEIDL